MKKNANEKIMMLQYRIKRYVIKQWETVLCAKP